MKRKNKIITFFSLIVISIILSFVIYNFNILFLKAEDRGIMDIDLNNIKNDGLEYNDSRLYSSNNENKSITINYSGFINKLIINYTTEDLFSIIINYSTKDY